MATENFLFVSGDGLITDIAWRVKCEGNNVKYSIKTEYARDVGDGLIPKTSNWRDELSWADVVVFDDTWGTGQEAQALRERGMPVIGGTPFTDKLEEVRDRGNGVMRDLGMEVVDGESFHSFDEAIEYIHKNPSQYVFKPSGEAQNYKQLLYVGKEPQGQDVIHLLKRYKNRDRFDLNQFQLQRRVDGVEISICGFFNGQTFLEPVNYTFEHKPLFPGEVGPMTGEMGTSMFWTEPTDLFDETLRPFEEILRTEGYHGPFDINCIVNQEHVYPLEITPRFGYPQVAIQEEGLKTNISTLLSAVARGSDPDLEVHPGFQVGARICVPPFPYDDMEVFEEQARGVPIWFDTDEDTLPEGVHLEDMKYEDNAYRVAGETGEIMVITGRGSSMRNAQENMYDLADRVIVPNMYYRNDIGDRWFHERDLLSTWNYI